MVKSMLAAAAFLFLLREAKAQDETPQNQDFIKKGLLRASATLSTGYMPAYNVENLYIELNGDYFIQDRISMRTDLYALTHYQWFDTYLHHGFNAFAGAAFHFPYYHWDTYLLLQPGLAVAKPYDAVDPAAPAHHTLEPMVNAGAGLTFYFSRSLHAYVTASYAYGNYHGASPAFRMDEVRAMAGIGFNVYTNSMPAWWRKMVKF